MQILITLPQLAGGKEREDEGRGKKGDEKQGSAAETVKQEKRRRDKRQGKQDIEEKSGESKL